MTRAHHYTVLSRLEQESKPNFLGVTSLWKCQKYYVLLMALEIGNIIPKRKAA